MLSHSTWFEGEVDELIKMLMFLTISKNVRKEDLIPKRTTTVCDLVKPIVRGKFLFWEGLDKLQTMLEVGVRLINNECFIIRNMLMLLFLNWLQIYMAVYRGNCSVGLKYVIHEHFSSLLIVCYVHMTSERHKSISCYLSMG